MNFTFTLLLDLRHEKSGLFLRQEQDPLCDSVGIVLILGEKYIDHLRFMISMEMYFYNHH